MTARDPGQAATPVQRAWAAEALSQHWGPPEGTEDLHDGGTHLLDLVAAVDHLARGLRHDFTVWDAIDEALHRWLTDQASHTSGAVVELGPPDSDPLGANLAQVLQVVAANPDITLADVVQQAIRRWTINVAERHNNGHHWPHPQPRRGFPPPAIGQ